MHNKHTPIIILTIYFAEQNIEQSQRLVEHLKSYFTTVVILYLLFLIEAQQYFFLYYELLMQFWTSMAVR